jgi:hypothetical protein
MMAKTPADRYQNASDVVRALKEVLPYVEAKGDPRRIRLVKSERRRGWLRFMIAIGAILLVVPIVNSFLGAERVNRAMEDAEDTLHTGMRYELAEEFDAAIRCYQQVMAMDVSTEMSEEAALRIRSATAKARAKGDAPTP